MRRSRPSKMAEPRPRALSSDRKVRKSADQPTITSRRVTLLPGFLSRGVQSETAYKHSESIPQPPEYDAPVLRPPDRSKSIFREIKERYAQEVGLAANHDFHQRLFHCLGPNFVPKESEWYKRTLQQEVLAVNAILEGKADPVDEMSSSMNRKRPYNEEDKENYPLKLSYIPPTKWVFQTPPNRKLHFGHTGRLEDSCMKPAIVESCTDGKIVYEVNNKINMDFTRYSNRQELDIDKRYMVEVANVQNNGEDFTFQFHDQENKQFQLQTDQYELENHFLSLTCRPKKAPCAVSRVATLKRKRDIFEPQPGCSTTDLETVNEFDSSFSFINNNLNTLEESFTFQFTSNDGSTTTHLFDFDGNKKDTFNFHF